MMRLPLTLCSLLVLSSLIVASLYREDLIDYNLNVNQTAKSLLDYLSTQANTTYTPSPENWQRLIGDAAKNQVAMNPHNM